MSRVRANKITNKDASGAPSFTHGAVVTGIVTATSFQGSGAALTGIDATALKDSGGSVKVQANTSGAVVTGILTATTGSFSGAVSVGGVLTYEDVTNVDAIGIVTARAGILVGAGKSVGIGTVTPRVPLEVHNTEATGTFINVKSKSNTLAGINFGDFEDDDIGSVRYGNGDNSLRFFANAGSEKFRIGSAGQWGIGGGNYGSSGQVLKSGGASAAPTWGAVSSGGKVLAYVNREDNTEYRVNTGTSWNAMHGSNLELPITPSATSSRILVMFNWGAITSYDGSCLGYGKIMRKIGSGSYADLTIGSDSGGLGQAMFGLNLETANHQQSNGLCCTFIDHPNTTSSVTYRPYFRTESGAGHIYINRNPRNGSNDISAVAFAYALELAG